MKQAYILIIAILALNIGVNAQVYEIILDQPLTGDSDFEALGRITLKPGFSSSGYSFTAKTNDKLNPKSGDYGIDLVIANPDENYNYIHTITPKEAYDEIALTSVLNTPAGLKQRVLSEQVQYFDGLGRALQGVAVNASPTGSDVVAHTLYDDYGRESKTYNPITRNNIEPGSFLPSLFLANNDPLAYQLYYVAMCNENPSMEETTAPYSETVFDGSPLNRVMKQGAPGVDWQPDPDTPERDLNYTEHVVSNNYSNNTSNEVRLLEVLSNGSLSISGTTPYYNANELFVNTTTDENGNQTSEYKNKQGQVILKLSNDGTNWLETYYVYDDFGLLRYVLPPMATDAMITNWANNSNSGNVSTETWLADYAYYYLYNEHKLMVEKKLPGAESVYMIYDSRDRLILTQDGEQGANGGSTEYWLFTQYDELNRPVMTGEVWMAAGSTFSTADLDHTNWTISCPSGGDYPETFPAIMNKRRIYTKTYYDSYDYTGALPFDQSTCIGTYNDGSGYETNVKGMVTGTKSQLNDYDILWEISTPYYDEYGRTIWNKKTVDLDVLGKQGHEIVSTQYSFTGEPERVMQQQEMYDDGTLVSSQVVEQNMVYDHAGRLCLSEMEVEGQPKETLAEYYYNDLGELQEKIIANGLQKIDYKYNERGWLTKLNDPDNMGTDLYAQELKYNDLLSGVTTSGQQYNGNISAMRWVSSNNSGTLEQKAYGFSYDNLNRLTAANYAEGSVLSINDKFTVNNISYDFNGNVTRLKRNDKNYDEYMSIDDLFYTYNGNQLTKVDDYGYGDAGFKYITYGIETQYTYDNNGNMLTDANKGITNIDYNHLNLPTQVTLAAGTVSYLYDAGGTKYKKTTSDGNGTRYYFSNFEYDKDMNLEYIHNGEGRIRAKDSYAYDYALKDHLGNTRVMFTDNGGSPEVLQVSNYYPFGMRHGQAPTYATADGDNQYLYNGKELQEDFNLDWYDYGARFYDAALGRWMCIDPRAEEYYSFSPYNYSLNNPILFLDPDGEGVWDVIKGVGKGAANFAVNTYEGLSSISSPAAMAQTVVGTAVAVHNAGGVSEYASDVVEGVKDNVVSKVETIKADQTGEATAEIVTEAALEVASIFVGGAGAASKAGTASKVSKVSKTTKLKQFSGTKKPWSDGATPNSVYTKIEPKTGNALQNTIYNSEGKAVGQVDFKPHMNKTQPSGHGHKMSEPGNLRSGHQGQHIPNSKLPAGWSNLPAGVKPMYPIE